MAQNIILLYGNHADVATLSGGNWLPGSPLSNLKTRPLRKVAQSTNLALASTQMNIALQGPQLIKAICLGPSNVRTGFRYRINSETTNTGWLEGTPRAEWNTLDWEDPNYWTGVAPWDDPERGMWLIHVFDTPVLSTYWLIEIDDQANPANFLRFGRLFMGRFWQPSINYGYGNNGLSFKDAAFKSTTLAGNKHFGRRTNPRVFRFGFDYLPEAELYGRGYEFQRIAGYDGEVFVIADPVDPLNIQKRSFLSTANTMDQLSQVAFGYGSTAFELEEVI